MESLFVWLQQLGLERYATVFADNDVDLEALVLLTEEDLEKLGVSLGHRRKLFKAIAERNRVPVSVPVAADESPAEPITFEHQISAEAQRRHLTVMFCDLVGSTALAARLDPEELRDLMQAYQRTCGEIVSRYEGHVAQYLGDGLMVYFGWPLAHEDEAVRAIRAGLEVVEAVSMLNASTPIRARVGIHTGLVVVGETGRGDASIPKAAVGDTPNIAARLQALAEPGCVAVSERTRALASGLFDYVDLGVQALKGIADPMQLFRVAGARATESRFDASRAEVALTPLVGRGEETALLLHRWQQAKDGEGQVVLLSGEPGIGKSRLTRVLRERLGQERHMVLRYQCSPYRSSSALYPAIEQLERAAGFDREDTADRKLDKMEALLAGTAPQIIERMPLFASLLSLPVDRYPPLDLSPQKQKDKMLEALAGRIEALAQRQPLLILWEDAHWIDATSQEFMDQLVPRLRNLPVLLIFTHRPEYSPRWTDQAHVTALSLNRLGRRQAAELVAKLTGGKQLPQEVLDQILAHTDGVPLFLEELIKSVLESGLLREASDRYVLEAPLPALAIPSTLRDSLLARLDRLAPVREVAQIGACIGREFSYDLLATVAPLKGERLDEALDQLTKTGLVFKRGTGADTLYTFKHALVRDTAYDSLLKSKRQELHAAIALALDTRFPEMHETEPEILGLHYDRAGFPEKAIQWYIKSGQQAKKRSAYREAIQSFERALSLMDQMQVPAKSRSVDIRLHSELGMLYLMLEGFASMAARTHLTRARELGVDATHDERFLPLVGLVEILSWDASKDEARRVGDELLRLAAATGTRVHSLYARQARGRSNMYMGRFREALTESQRAIEIYDPQTDTSLAFEYGYDPGVFALSSIAYSHGVLGYLERAARYTDECVALARKVGQPYTLSFALAIPGADIWYFMRDPAKALQFAREGREVSARWGFGYIEAMCNIHAGWATAMQGDYAEGLACMTRALDAIRNMGVWAVTPRMTAQVASVYAAAGRADEGLRVLESSPDRQPGRTRVRYGEIYRIEGDLHRLKSSPDLELAEACYQEAIRIAVEDETKLAELRATTSLAKLWQEQGKHRQAHELLSPVFGWFTEGAHLRDLREAKALLDELNACQAR